MKNLNLIFSGIDFSRTKAWDHSEDVEAKRLFTSTNEVFSYGFILPDGTRLDFSKGLEGSERDHYAIRRAFSERRLEDIKKRARKAGIDVFGLDDIREEIKYEATAAGLIRLYRSGNAYMVHVMKKPTRAQMDCLYDMADSAEDAPFSQMELMLGTDNLVSYESNRDFELRFVNDVRNAFSSVDEALSGKDSTRLRRQMKKGVVDFSYKKKSTGEIRTAKGTLMKSKLPEFADDRPARPNVRNFVYWDVEKNQFRCFNRDNFIGFGDINKEHSKIQQDKQDDKNVNESLIVSPGHNEVWYRVQNKGKILKPSPANFFYCTPSVDYIDAFMVNRIRPEILCFTISDKINAFDLLDKDFYGMMGYPCAVYEWFNAEALPTALSYICSFYNEIKNGTVAEIRRILARYDKEYLACGQMLDKKQYSDMDLLDFFKWCKFMIFRTDGKTIFEHVVNDMHKIDSTINAIKEVESLIIIDVSALEYMASGIKPLSKREFDKLLAKFPEIRTNNDFDFVSNAICQIRKEHI